jgi:AcrR family transcriptional regulator
MPERENRREKILEAASVLFMERGYQATSVRQIAETVGCTEAALYYHFKAGKRELLQQVVNVAEVDLNVSLAEIQAATSLRDLIERYGDVLVKIRGGRLQKTIRWMTLEMRHLSPDERETFYQPLLEFHQAVRDVAGRYVSDPVKADNMAWLLICTGFGFRQIFDDMELGRRVNMDVRKLYDLLVEQHLDMP